MPDARWPLAGRPKGQSTRLQAWALLSRGDWQPAETLRNAHGDEGVGGHDGRLIVPIHRLKGEFAEVRPTHYTRCFQPLTLAT